mmetsp:Transcript_64724/g.204353  ORF Transcript_64724/g.204353 Transcript_64724/m.204353 type:complete len:278 (+) Transcript_64724:172-1005(+)
MACICWFDPVPLDPRRGITAATMELWRRTPLGDRPLGLERRGCCFLGVSVTTSEPGISTQSYIVWTGVNGVPGIERPPGVSASTVPADARMNDDPLRAERLDMLRAILLAEALSVGKLGMSGNSSTTPSSPSSFADAKGRCCPALAPPAPSIPLFTPWICLNELAGALMALMMLPALLCTPTARDLVLWTEMAASCSSGGGRFLASISVSSLPTRTTELLLALLGSDISSWYAWYKRAAWPSGMPMATRLSTVQSARVHHVTLCLLSSAVCSSRYAL